MPRGIRHPHMCPSIARPPTTSALPRLFISARSDDEVWMLRVGEKPELHQRLVFWSSWSECTLV